MSSRHRRTRIYGANYDIGESYYKKQLNELDNKAGSHRNINGTLGVDTLNENKLNPKVSFLCSDSDYNDTDSRLMRHNLNSSILEDVEHKNYEKVLKHLDDFDNSKLMRRNVNASNFEESSRKKYDKLVTDLKHFDDFEDQFLKGTTKLKATEIPLDSRLLRNESPDVPRSYMKYSLDKEETPSSFSKKADVSVSVRSKYLMSKEHTDEDFEASHRVNATKARLHDLEEEMSTIAKKQSEREKRNLNLKKMLSSTSHNEHIENY